MDTVIILNHYRHAISNDELGTIIISLLIKNGAASEDLIIEILKRPPHSIKSKIDQLFKAKLIELTPENLWKATPFAIRILNLLGITSGITYHILYDFNLSRTDKSILEALNLKIIHKSEGNKDIVGLYRHGSYVIKSFNQFFSQKDSKERYLYSLLWVQNPTASYLDTNSYCELFSYNKSSQKRFDLLKLCDDIHIYKFDLYHNQALRDIKDSNYYFLHGHQHRELPKDDDFVWLFSAGRILNAFFSGKFDEQLSDICFSGHGDKAINSLISDNKFLKVFHFALIREGYATEKTTIRVIDEMLRNKISLILLDSCDILNDYHRFSSQFHSIKKSETSNNTTTIKAFLSKLSKMNLDTNLGFKIKMITRFTNSAAGKQSSK